MGNDERTITEADLETLDRTALGQATGLARTASWVLMGAGVLGALAWLWVSVRAQQTAGGSSSGLIVEEEGMALVDRISLFTSTIPILMLSAAAFGVGAVVRLLADHVQLAAGLSLLGLQVGDPWPGTDLDDDAGDAEDADELIDLADGDEDEDEDEDEQPTS